MPTPQAQALIKKAICERDFCGFVPFSGGLFVTIQASFRANGNIKKIKGLYCLNGLLRVRLLRRTNNNLVAKEGPKF